MSREYELLSKNGFGVLCGILSLVAASVFFAIGLYGPEPGGAPVDTSLSSKATQRADRDA